MDGNPTPALMQVRCFMPMLECDSRVCKVLSLLLDGRPLAQAKNEAREGPAEEDEGGEADGGLQSRLDELSEDLGREEFGLEDQEDMLDEDERRQLPKLPKPTEGELAPFRAGR